MGILDLGLSKAGFMNYLYEEILSFLSNERTIKILKVLGKW